MPVIAECHYEEAVRLHTEGVSTLVARYGVLRNTIKEGLQEEDAIRNPRSRLREFPK